MCVFKKNMSKIVFGTGFKDSAQRISIEKYDDVIEIRVSDVTGMHDREDKTIPTITYTYANGGYHSSTAGKKYNKYELAEYLQTVGKDDKKWVSKVVVRNNHLKLIRYFGFDDDLVFKVFTGDCLQIDHNIVINTHGEFDYNIPALEAKVTHL